MAKTTVFTLLCLLCQAMAFAPLQSYERAFAMNARPVISKPTALFMEPEFKDIRSNIITTTMGISSGLVMGGGASSMALAAEVMDDYEIAELPPPYIPIVFALALVAGVGVLTGSLGDVIADGTF